MSAIEIFLKMLLAFDFVTLIDHAWILILILIDGIDIASDRLVVSALIEELILTSEIAKDAHLVALASASAVTVI